MDNNLSTTIHSTADVSPDAQIGERTRIWHDVQVREGARIGTDCILGKGVYVDHDVVVGDRCKVQNRVSLYHGVTLEDGVFVGPHAVFTNDRYPRAITPSGELQTDDDWETLPTIVRTGASIGAGAVILAGVELGEWSMVAAGAVVTADVPAHAVVKGNPARFAGWACDCGRPLVMSEARTWWCEHCQREWRFR
jgi:acetyltransferase-like isoleucine patch superfamily enzyme